MCSNQMIIETVFNLNMSTKEPKKRWTYIYLCIRHYCWIAQQSLVSKKKIIKKWNQLICRYWLPQPCFRKFFSNFRRRLANTAWVFFFISNYHWSCKNCCWRRYNKWCTFTLINSVPGLIAFGSYKFIDKNKRIIEFPLN